LGVLPGVDVIESRKGKKKEKKTRDGGMCLEVLKKGI